MKSLHRLICTTALLLGGLSQFSFGTQTSIQANDDTVNISSVALPITLDHLTDNDFSTGSVFIFTASQPLFGHLAIKPNNVIVYTPIRGFAGADSFRYYISSGLNGAGAVSSALVTIRNPYLLAKGTFSAAITGGTQAHESSGYLQLTTDSKASFTASLRYAGQTFRIKNTFDVAGNYVATINRGGSMPDLQLELQFALTGPPKVDCRLTVGAQITTFTATRSPWSRTNKPQRSGIYTMVLRVPDTAATTPQGTGYAYFRVGTAGSVSVLGRTGENRSFSSTTLLQADNTFPLYAMLYHGTGSLFGRATMTVMSPTNVTLASNLTWFKPKNVKDAFYPKGFNLTVPAVGSLYLQPLANTTILPVPTLADFNSKFKIEAGNIRIPRIERALLGRWPDAGLYELSFDNFRRLAAKVVISPKTGIFKGSFYDTTARARRPMTGVFVQSESAAYGVWNTPTKTGRVELKPDTLVK